MRTTSEETSYYLERLHSLEVERFLARWGLQIGPSVFDSFLKAHSSITKMVEAPLLSILSKLIKNNAIQVEHPTRYSSTLKNGVMLLGRHGAVEIAQFVIPGTSEQIKGTTKVPKKERKSSSTPAKAKNDGTKQNSGPTTTTT